MRGFRLRTIAGLLCLCCATVANAQQPPATAAVPKLVRFSGFFRPADGARAQTMESVTLSGYRDQTGGNALWQEIQNVVVDVCPLPRDLTLSGCVSAVYQGRAKTMAFTQTLDVLRIQDAKWKSDGNDGANPAGGLVFDAAGNAYGTTCGIYQQQPATVLQLSPQADGTWRETDKFRWLKDDDSCEAEDFPLD